VCGGRVRECESVVMCDVSDCVMHCVCPILVYMVTMSSGSLSVLGVKSARSEHGMLRQLHSTTQRKVSMLCSEGVMCGLYIYTLVWMGTVCICVEYSVCVWVCVGVGVWVCVGVCGSVWVGSPLDTSSRPQLS